jgi:hypothetical protein
MNRLEKIEIAIQVLQQAAQSQELLDQLQSEFGVNFGHSLASSEIVLKRAAERQPEQIRKALEAGECLITFIKNDGTECTKLAKRDPEVAPSQQELGRPHLIYFWDVEAGKVKCCHAERVVKVQEAR